jgi:hypothetical protein
MPKKVTRRRKYRVMSDMMKKYRKSSMSRPKGKERK